jgi:hypothetical protein
MGFAFEIAVRNHPIEITVGEIVDVRPLRGFDGIPFHFDLWPRIGRPFIRHRGG